MELRVLRYFLMVAREENITRAAQFLHLTQPTLSRQLAALERELGVKLFRRSNHNIVLTEQGMLLKRRAQELISLADKTEREFHQAESLGGELAIGSGELQSTHLLSELLAAFHRENPLVRFEIYSGNADNIKDRIESGNLDLGLLLEPVDIGRYDFVRMPGREQWGVLVSEDSPLAQQQAVGPELLAGEPLIFSRRELVQHELLNWFGPYADQITTTASGNLLYNMAALARSRLGVVMCLRLDCRYEGLRYVPLSPPLTSGTVLVWKKAQTLSPTAQAFIRHTKKYLKSISDDSI
ncbi:LysR family transcriptional regulator [Feifania hominis]|uniref:LysR family transcriptional regulator n=1 Tax=Feifania hominis TaxID=2763660 RepID=A0A926DF09_9FIRM|nr:LysR family transcriptional regulator [Feifania hominis]MBC8536938.1 LysR family transcriptional regulator [Feifania hominis]